MLFVLHRNVHKLQIPDHLDATLTFCKQTRKSTVSSLLFLSFLFFFFFYDAHAHNPFNAGCRVLLRNGNGT